MNVAVPVDSRAASRTLWLQALLRRYPFALAGACFVTLVAVNGALQPNLFEAQVLVSNLSTWLPMILVATGQTYVILASDIDLSVGSIVSLVNVTVVSAIDAFGGGGAAIALGILCGVTTGAACGLVNGLCVAWLRFQPIVTTFATGIVFGGVALWVLPEAGKQAPAAFWESYAGTLLGVPVVVWILASAVLFCAWFALSGFYRSLLAVGGDMQSAFQSGLAVVRVRITAYVVCGVFSALAALVLVGETATGDPLLGGAFTLSSISAVVLGGTALSGGVGSSFGSLLGAMILGLINNVIFFAGLPFEYQNLVQGLIVLAALAGGVFASRH